MALPDTLIHRAELLITLDYLLNHTDEKHPATQQDICRYARNFGFKYVDNAKVGNDVRRQRIGDVLKFLEVTSADFPDNFPFIMETTNSGKYYIDQKNGLHKEQIASVLAAIKNDKYTKDEDTDYLIKQVLNAFGTSEDNRQEILKEYQERSSYEPRADHIFGGYLKKEQKPENGDTMIYFVIRSRDLASSNSNVSECYYYIKKSDTEELLQRLTEIEK